MALKAARIVDNNYITTEFYCNAIIERGSPVGIVETTEFDIVDTSKRCKNFLGITIQDVVDIDLRMNQLNYNEQVQKGSKVAVATRGTFVVNTIDSSFKNAALLSDVYVDFRTNKFTTRSHKHTSTKVGRFFSRDDDGFVKIEINV